MFGPKISTVFTSRWKALWWAAGVMLTAYCTVPSPDGETPDAAPHGESRANNPWASDVHKPFADDKNLRDLEALRHRLP